MSLVVVALLAVAGVLVWWVLHRSARLRREAESREAKLLEALFAARQSAGGGAHVDVDGVFGSRRAADRKKTGDAVLRVAGLQSEIVELLGEAQAAAKAAQEPPPDSLTSEGTAVGGAAATSEAAGPHSAPPPADARPTEAPVEARDLVQVFYEARGFRAVPLSPAAPPIELVLVHKAEAHRSYAFAPLTGELTEAAVRSTIEQARAIDQRRVLIVVDGQVAPELASAMPTKGVRVFDRAAIEAQLARLDAGMAEKLRATAQRRANQRLRGAS